MLDNDRDGKLQQQELIGLARALAHLGLLHPGPEHIFHAFVALPSALRSR